MGKEYRCLTQHFLQNSPSVLQTAIGSVALSGAHIVQKHMCWRTVLRIAHLVYVILYS